MNRAFYVALLGVLLGASLGCAGYRAATPPDRAGRLAAAPEDRDFLASFNDYAVQENRFLAWWGPHAANSCPVDMKIDRQAGSHVATTAPSVDDPGVVTIADAPRLLLDIGDEPCPYTVYLDGKFRGEPDPSVALLTDPALKAKELPIWPIVYANRIQVGASGTQFFVHVDGRRHIIGRLKGSGGTLYVNRRDHKVDTASIQPSETQDRYLVYVTEALPNDPLPEFGAQQTPAAGSPEEALFSEVRRRHAVHVGHYPPIPDQP